VCPIDQHNHLVVSDLHLAGEPGLQVGLRSVDRAFIQFLDWHAAHWREERPWRLIIAGDGIDFLHRSLHGAEGAEPHQEHTEARAIETLEAIVAENRPVFEALARFVAAGHELVFLQGNHDAELHWAGVQDRLRALLLELFAGLFDGTVDMAILEELQARVSIHRWFYYRRDLLYVEHGNQYDELCAFENVLCPVDEDARIAAPVSHVTLRRFRDLLHRLDAHNVDRWGLGDFLRWVVRLEPRAILRSAVTYLSSPTWLLHLDGRRRRAVPAARQVHHSRLRDLLEHFPLEEEVLHLLERLKRTSRGNLWLGLRMLFYDQVALGGLLAAAVALLCLTPGPAAARVAVGLGAALGAMHLSRRGLRSRQVDPQPKLVVSAQAVAGLLRVPFVVFGHSHTPEVRALPEAATYVNTGSWTHEGEAGLTYFQLTAAPGGSQGTLRRWAGA